MKFSSIILSVSAALFAGAVNAATVTLSPTADGDVQVHGGDVFNTTDGVLSFVQSGALIRNAIMEFDLSSIVDTATINSATLTITLTQFVSDLGSTAAIDLFAYNGNGAVDIDDYDAAGTQVADTTTPTGGVAGDTRSFSFSTVAPITSALSGNLLTLRLETDNFATIFFGALENTTIDAAALTIDYTGPSAVPLPAGLPLLLVGLGGLAALRRGKGA
ncbi:VPLPA-CTERM protein sorting domain-containing protein [Poseidonocella sedimentorum]|uniref:VPLPA-CTERM protein sorting domain-containing protein n=2 Tax=Poseidonocella sedimentorum TaxID=871652 RepID=A0A1I6CV34_9RHOB|nr:VPLPA-CTERM protein sorting domain-containing protein [Poseidonocella sedimentorum]